MDYLKCKVEIYNKELSDLGIDSDESIWADAIIFKSEISAMRESLSEPGKCIVYIKSGDSFVLNDSYQNILRQIIYER